MSWLTEADENSTQTSEEKWLRFPENDVVNKSVEVTVRFLDAIPEDAWQHWLENRVFVCPGMETCPVCKVRNPLLKGDREGTQKKYRMTHRFFANVLLNGEVKIFAFGPGLAKQLLVFVKKYEEKYGDITSYDISIQKRKTGKLPQNVEYTVIPEVPPRELTDEELVAAETKYDLSFTKTPASREDLMSVAIGELPARPEAESTEDPKAR